MNYPYRIEDITSVEGKALVLWEPDPVVQEGEALLDRGSSVLDVGSAWGSNGFFMAMQGHEVTSVEINPDYIENGQRIARSIGSLALNNKFVRGDMVELDAVIGNTQFDAVIATRALQQVKKMQTYKVIEKMQNLTKPGGLNIILAYIATPQQQKQMPWRALLEPEELPGLYAKAGWSEVSYDYDLKPLDNSYNNLGCVSTGKLISRKPTVLEEVKRSLLRRADYYRNSDPEYYNLLMEEADLY